MDTESLPAGRYVAAISGGVDSMVLLDLLCRRKELEIIVAHFNHGIRDNAKRDEEFVRRQAKRRGLLFEAGREKLGAHASEAAARRARYRFLTGIRQKYEALGIITAHHQDDLIETAFINIIRGTGPKGLIAMASGREIMRPLLSYPKADIIRYAKEHKLDWVEDETNEDDKYLRNYLRHSVMNTISPEERERLLEQLEKVRQAYKEIDEIFAAVSKKVLLDDRTIDRSAFIELTHDVASGFIKNWLKDSGLDGLDKMTIERLVTAIKTSPPASRHHIKHDRAMILTKEDATLV